MCTVSFYRDNSKVIITSNRDEHINRPLAFAPKGESYGAKSLYYPKDPQAGGTWFAVSSKGFVFVLLNGGETKHIPNPPYRKSRGIILLEIASSSNLEDVWNDADLINIEPFTIIAFVNKQLIKIRWNGNKKTFKSMNVNTPLIWSSSTLYEQTIIEERKDWFCEFLSRKKEKISAVDLIEFHTSTKREDETNGLLINRNQKILTKNVTQCVVEANQFTLSHLDLKSNTKTEIIKPII